MFPERDRVRAEIQKAHHAAAIICRRGHIVKVWVDLDEEVDETQKCVNCGAAVVVACANCDLRVRGRWTWPDKPGSYSPPGFCDGCGSAHPWATREQRIYELENILDQQGTAESDRLLVGEHLRQLRELDVTELERADALWKSLGKRAKWFILSPETQPIIETLSKVAIEAAK